MSALEFRDRFLSFIDLDPLSPTFGCADRDYWHYRSIKTFPVSTFQNTALIFALWWKNAGGEVSERKTDLRAGLALIDFWAKSINKDGSFQENYQNESSFIGTAFSLYHVSEALIILGSQAAKQDFDIYCRAVEKSADWLSSKSSDFCANQNCAAAAALVSASVLLNKESFLTHAQSLIQSTHSMMDREEGWLYEYGGFDPGYTTVALDYLGRIKKNLTGTNQQVNHQVNEIALSSINLLKSALSVHSPSGVRLGSRNTGFLFPYGISCFLEEDPAGCSHLLSIIEKGMDKKELVTFNSMDDRYLATYVSTCVEYYYSKPVLTVEDQAHPPGDLNLEQAGFFVKRLESKDTTLQVSLKRGGNLRISSADSKTWCCNNLSIKAGGSVFSSSGFNPDVKVGIEEKGETLTISASGYMKHWNYLLPLAGAKGGLVSLYLAVFAGMKFITRVIDVLLRKKYILGSNDKRVEWQRRISISPQGVEVEDTISAWKKIDKYDAASDLFPAHVNTNRYWTDVLESCCIKGDVTISPDKKKLLKTYRYDFEKGTS